MLDIWYTKILPKREPLASISGNKDIAAFTQLGDLDLRIDLEDFNGTHVYAVYTHFSLNPKDYYRLKYTAYSGNAGGQCDIK